MRESTLDDEKRSAQTDATSSFTRCLEKFANRSLSWKLPVGASRAAEKAVIESLLILARGVRSSAVARVGLTLIITRKSSSNLPSAKSEHEI